MRSGGRAARVGRSHRRRGDCALLVSLDFVHDQLACGRRFRILNIVDDVTRECLAAIPDTSISRPARGATDGADRRRGPGR